jgi:uncharacterized protein YdiU (UPF0061 family)
MYNNRRYVYVNVMSVIQWSMSDFNMNMLCLLLPLPLLSYIEDI